MSEDVLTEDEIFEEIIEDNEAYRNIPNYVTLTDEDKEILKTEINICEKCYHPNIIGVEPFNRRQKEVVQMKLDNIVNSLFSFFCKKNKLDKNAGLALLLKLVSEPEIAKLLTRQFLPVGKRKGSRFRSDMLASAD